MLSAVPGSRNTKVIKETKLDQKRENRDGE